MADEAAGTKQDGADFWRAHIRAWRRSEVSRAAYCREHGLEPHRFHHWVGRLRGEFRRQPGARGDGAGDGSGPDEGGFIPVRLGTDNGAPLQPLPLTEGETAGCQSSADAGPGGSVEVVIGGAVVRVASPVDGAALRAVLDAVRATA